MIFEIEILNFSTNLKIFCEKLHRITLHTKSNPPFARKQIPKVIPSSRRENAQEEGGSGAMKRHVSLLVIGVSSSKNVSRPWYDDFWGRKGQSGPSPRLVQSKWRRNASSMTRSPYGDNLSASKFCWGGRRFFSRRGNAWVTHPWKSGKSRDTVDTPWSRLKSWLVGETESWKYNRPRCFCHWRHEGSR